MNDKDNDKKPRDWNQLMIATMDGLVLLGDMCVLIWHTLAVSLGVPVILALTVVVEQQRVQHGLELFERDVNLAAFGSWVLVIINMVFEFQAHHTEHKAGFKLKEETEFSFRTVANRAGYVIGIGKGWEARLQSPAQRYYRVGRIVTIAILALALAGSMKDQLQEQTGAWYRGLWSVVTESTLLEMATWMGGLLFAFAAVMSAQASSRYIAIRFVEIRNQMRYRKQSERTQLTPELTVAQPGMPPVWGEHRRADLQPLKVKVDGGTTKYKCPNCGNLMSRQGWQKHPCRFTEVAPSIDSQVDPVDTFDEYVDINLVNETVKYATNVKQAVNGHVNSIAE